MSTHTFHIFPLCFLVIPVHNKCYFINVIFTHIGRHQFRLKSSSLFSWCFGCIVLAQLANKAQNKYSWRWLGSVLVCVCAFHRREWIISLLPMNPRLYTWRKKKQDSVHLTGQRESSCKLSKTLYHLCFTSSTSLVLSSCSSQFPLLFIIANVLFSLRFLWTLRSLGANKT